MMTPHDRYRRDPMFRALVDQLQVQIRDARYTPSELREAVILAATLEYESRPPEPFLLDPDAQICRRVGPNPYTRWETDWMDR